MRIHICVYIGCIYIGCQIYDTYIYTSDVYCLTWEYILMSDSIYIDMYIYIYVCIIYQIYIYRMSDIWYIHIIYDTYIYVCIGTWYIHIYTYIYIHIYILMSDSTYRTSDKKHLIKMREILLTHVCAYTKHMMTMRETLVLTCQTRTRISRIFKIRFLSAHVNMSDTRLCIYDVCMHTCECHTPGCYAPSVKGKNIWVSRWANSQVATNRWSIGSSSAMGWLRLVGSLKW